MTFIELIVAIGILLVLLPIVTSVIGSLYRTQGETLARAAVLSATTEGVKDIIRDVRSSVYGEDGSLPLVTIASSTLTLYTDTDLDGRIERVRYFLSGTTLRKGVVEPSATSSYSSGSEVVSDYLRNVINFASSTSVFKYYTATSTQVTSQSRILDVRRVEVNVIAQNRVGQKLGTITLTSSASVRNLKDTY